MRVLAFLGAGIVGDCIGSLLSRWGASATIVTGDSDALLPADGALFDAIVIDTDVSDGGLLAAAMRTRTLWGLQHVPVIMIARLRPAGTHAFITSDQLKVLTKPVRALALYETLSSASVRRGPAVLRDPRTFASETLAQDSLAILLVEDNEPNRYVLRLMIEELGLKADEAGSGLEAVECARKREYDVILMDVQMSGLDGLEATRRIRGEPHGKPPIIIALTAGVMVNDEPRCREAGMDGYLPKPVRLDTLAATLRPLALGKIPT